MAKILLVEDDDNQRLLYHEEFAGDGHEVIEVRNGREALAWLARERVDAVVLDINMPDMDGLDTLTAIHNLDRHVPIVLNSAYSAYKDQFVSWLADAYVIKSSNVAELRATVQSVLLRRIES